jgi:uncharacterized OB-fold protein
VSIESAAGKAVSFDPAILALGAEGGGYLIGSKCSQCASVYFPRQTFCTACMAENTLADCALSKTGQLYAYTVVTRESIAPKGFEVPYVYGYVDLPEGVRVVSKIVGWDEATLTVDMPVELVVEKLRSHPDGTTVMAYRHRPIQAAGTKGGRQ